MTALFADTGLVIRRGKVFEAGDYPDERFSLTPEEMAQAVEKFRRAPIKDAHDLVGTSIFTGLFADAQAGVVGLAVDPQDPKTLLADVAIPQWLDELMAGKDIKVSAEWNRKTKEFEALGLLTDPAIQDAALVAAFAKAQHNTPTGQRAIQRIHDVAAESGAVCNKPAAMSSRHESSAIQQAHDVSVEHGAACADANAAPMPMWFSRAARAPAAQENATARFSGGGRKGALMSWFTDFANWAKGGYQGDAPADPTEATLASIGITPQTPAATFAAVTPLHPAVQAIPGQVLTQPDPEKEQLRKRAVEAEAKAFFMAEFAAHRATPDEQEGFVDEYVQAALDDETHGTVTFSSGKHGTRLDKVKARLSQRQPHELTQTLLPTDANGQDAAARFNAVANTQTTPQAGAAKQATPERRRALLAQTPAGRAALERMNQNN